MILFRLVLTIALAVVFSPVVHANDGYAAGPDGEALNVHNNTGHQVILFAFQDDKVHLNEAGGTQIAIVTNGASAVVKVPHCKFSVILIDHEDVWHAEFHDCHTTDVTFTKDTNHAKKRH